MTDNPAGREPLPLPKRQFDYRHLIPIAKLLIQRGHLPLEWRPKYGFCPEPDGQRCYLTHAFTDEDWAAVNDRFVVPESIVFARGAVRDWANGCQIEGHPTILTDDGEIPIEIWEAQQDWSDLPEDVASGADHLRR